MRQYEGHIDNGTRVIESARSDAERAAGYNERARGSGEKARYSRILKLVSPDEYRRLFDLAVKDHNEAVRLDPGNAEMYLSRGQTYHQRAAAAWEDKLDPKAKTRECFDLAKADFTRAIERDGHNQMAFDMRGMINEHNGDYQQAIDDYMTVMKSDPRLGKGRLAGLYCNRGGVWQGEKKFELAASDYEKSIELLESGAAADDCDCDPYAPLAGTYCDGLKQYDKSWQIVHKAAAHRRWMPQEFVEHLKKVSGKDR